MSNGKLHEVSNERHGHYQGDQMPVEFDKFGVSGPVAAHVANVAFEIKRVFPIPTASGIAPHLSCRLPLNPACEPRIALEHFVKIFLPKVVIQTGSLRQRSRTEIESSHTAFALTYDLDLRSL